MKKIITLILSLILIISAFTFGACGKKSGDGDGNKNEQIEEIYSLYVANAESKGTTPLSYEDWLSSIKGEKGDPGKDGVGIKNAYINEDGELIIILDDNKEINAGSVGGVVKDENPQGLAFHLLPDGTYGVSVGNARYLRQIAIPAVYKGKPVTAIKGIYGTDLDGFGVSLTINKIIIPNSIKTIDGNTFKDCKNVSSITIPESVVNIGRGAFENSGVKVIFCETSEKPEGWDERWYGWSRDFDIVWDCKNNDISDDGYCYVEKDGLLYAIKNEEAVLIGLDVWISDVVVPSTVFHKGVEYPVTKIECYFETEFNDIYYGGVRNLTLSENIKSISINDLPYNIESLSILNKDIILSGYFGDWWKIDKINFNGTIAEWKAVQKEENWNIYNAIKTIKCTDGDIDLTFEEE